MGTTDFESMPAPLADEAGVHVSAEEDSFFMELDAPGAPGGVDIPIGDSKLEVRRINDEDQPAEILMENFPDVDGKPAAQHLCLFDNLPVMPDVPEQDAEQHEQHTGIVDPRTGRPFEMN